MSIFRRTAEDDPAPTSPPPRASAPAGATWIGEHTVLEGKIVTNDDLCIQGRLQGTVAGRSSVLVPEGGRVNADIEARTVTIHGQVVGNIGASEQAEIGASGSLVGIISAPSVVVRPGAAFEGTVRQGGGEDPADRQDAGS